MKERNLLFDNMKGILIFLVVLGHSLEFLKHESEIAKIIYTFIYIFHMPTFIFISGYFSKNLEKSRDSAFEKFLIPFLLITLPWNTALVLLGVKDVYSFFIPAWAMWYLYSMFVWKLILPYLLKVKNVFKMSIILGIFSGLFLEFNAFMSISRTITFFPYFLAGYFFNENLIDTLKSKPKLPFILCILFIFFISIYFSISNLFPIEFLWLDRSFIALGYPQNLGLMLRTLLYILGFLMIFCLINIIPTKKYFLSKIGKNTLSVYLLHIFLVGIIFGITNNLQNNLLSLFIAIVSSILITYILSLDIVNNTTSKFIKYIISKIINV
ncbi:acyltransferase family protein [[Clostridium] colinum]|uniref:acyltransferase family protein n=1 Tax=[Clostridium] colinum TaxID=36835 RepID=UPI002025A1B2|nr:acyltransferase family protein [[Clostridium] colinum]